MVRLCGRNFAFMPLCLNVVLCAVCYITGFACLREDLFIGVICQLDLFCRFFGHCSLRKNSFNVQELIEHFANNIRAL